MAQQTIFLGTTANDLTGDTLRDGGQKINENFTELYNIIGGSGTAIELSVAQTGHGLSVGNAIKVSGANTFSKAQASSAANAEVVGVVTTVTDADNFKYVTHGYFTAGVPSVAAGTVMFLSPTTPGALTATEPSTVGQVSKPLVIVTENGAKAIFNNFRGLVVQESPITALSMSTIAVNTNAVKNTHYIMTASLTLTLPATPTDGDYLVVTNMSGVSTCVIARNGLKIMGLSEDFTYEKLNVTSTFKYSGATYGWLII